MNRTQALIALIFWSFVVTVEAQFAGNYPQPAGPGAVPWNNPEEHLYTAPQVPVGPHPGAFAQETVNIYQHPDDGPLDQAPYITVPVQPGTGNSYWGTPWRKPW